VAHCSISVTDAPARNQLAVRSGLLAARAAGYGALAVALTWPLVLRLGTQLPLGTEPVATVPRFNLWTMEWNARGLGPLRSGYWNAPIFSPTRGTFAFSDPQPLTGAVYHVLTSIGLRPTAGYAVILLAALAVNGLAAAMFLDDVGVAPAPASLAGVLMVALPFVANELGVVQLVMVWPMLFGLRALHRYFARPDYARAGLVGLWVAVSLLTSEYYAFFLLVALVVVGVVYLVGRRLQPVRLAHAAVAFGVLLVLGAPFVIAQSSRIGDYAWPEATVAALGASPRDWFRLPASTLGSGLPGVGTAHGTELALYPGTVLLVLAYLGLAGARRGRQRWIVAILTLGVVASLLADGLGLHFFGLEPYAFLRDHVAGFARIRSPFRWSVLTQVCVALLAGLGLDALWRWRRSWGPAIAIALTALAVFEVAQLPAHTAPAIRGDNADWIAYLQHEPDAPIAMVPFPVGPSEVDYTGTTLGMLLTLRVDQPSVNGYSGFFPADYVALRKEMADFPDDRTLASLRAFGVRRIVVENRWLTPERRARLRALGFAARPQFTGRDRSVYEVPPA
jgi:hypothetical protein